MARTIRLRAVVDLEHRGQPIAVGEEFDATQDETLLLAHGKKVEFAQSHAAPLITRDMSASERSMVTTLPESKPKRQYRRRDLTAESAT